MPLQVRRYTYPYNGQEREIYMIVTSITDTNEPVGYEVWRAADNRWIVDDEPTTIVHRILTDEVVISVQRVTGI